MALNLADISYDQLVKFIFDHPLPDPSHPKEWYWDIDREEVNVDLNKQTLWLTRLFREASTLLNRFSPKQLEQGFWLIMGPAGGDLGFLEDILWNPEIAWELRCDCIASMVDLFRELFARDPVESVCFMWWDSLAWDYNHEHDPTRNEEDARVQQAMFEALTQILELECTVCQQAALHGLGHLQHPNTEHVIQDFLARHPSLDDKLKQYALACKDGKMQ